MQPYLFILGRDIELSLAEITAYFGARNVPFLVEEQERDIVKVTLPPLAWKKVIKELGGTVRIARILQEDEPLYPGRKNKIHYAFTRYGPSAITQKDVVRRLKEERVKAFLKKPKRGKRLMPSDVTRHRLVEEGLELLAWKTFLARTVAVFDPKEHEQRDQDRPVKDYRKVISIRLAKILINLSHATTEVLDPFCGYGTILQEGLLKGLDAVGIDIDQEMVEASCTNLRWLEKKYAIKRSWKVCKGNSQQLHHFVPKAEALASEPYLGPFLKQLPSRPQAEQILQELTALYDTFLGEARQVVRRKIAVVVPAFETKGHDVLRMDVLQIAQRKGLRPWAWGGPMPIPYDVGRIRREIWVLEAP